MIKDDVIEFLRKNDYSFLIKILKPEYLNDLLDGNLYMNNAEFYNQLENEGQGDKYDSKIFRSKEENKGFEAILKDKNDRVLPVDISKICFYDQEQLKFPVYCMFQLDCRNLHSYELHDKQLLVRYEIEKDIIEKLKENFGPSSKIVIFYKDFIETRIENTLENCEYEYRYGAVSYEITNIQDQLKWHGFYKRNCFSHQQEWRLVIKGIPKDNHVILNIGDLSKNCFILTFDELEEFGIEMKIDIS